MAAPLRYWGAPFVPPQSWSWCRTPSSLTPRTKAPGCTCAASSPEVTQGSLPHLPPSPAFPGCPLNVGVPLNSPPTPEDHLCLRRLGGRIIGRHLLPPRQGESGHLDPPQKSMDPPSIHLGTPEHLSAPKTSGGPPQNPWGSPTDWGGTGRESPLTSMGRPGVSILPVGSEG